MYQAILVEKKENVVTITLNRPQTMNAIDLVMREELRQTFIELERDDDVRVVVITGSGRAFCAGSDLSSAATLTPNSARKRVKNIHQLYKAIINSDKIYIAAINGHAIGSGLSLACACDFRVASGAAKIGTPFINMGLVPDSGMMYTLPRLVGLAKTKEMTMLGQTITAKQAMDMGLFTRLVEPERLTAAVDELAADLCSRSYMALALNKSIINRSFELDMDSLMNYEAYAQDAGVASDSYQDAMSAIMPKKKK